MSRPRVYIRSHWDESKAYECGVGELLANNPGNHLEDQLESLRDKLAGVISLLVEKDLLTMTEVANACNYNESYVITQPLRSYSFTIKKQHKSRRALDIVDIVLTSSTDFDDEDRPYSIAITDTVVDTGTREEMYAKYPDIKHLGNGL